jgi:hypothetical protein
VFRVTFATSPYDREALLRSLTSNYELQQKPRKIERIYSVLHFAISTWTSEDAARANARAWPKNGDHIARLDLLPGLGGLRGSATGGVRASLAVGRARSSPTVRCRC